jgi:uncharacterized membrane protein YjjP (DUF1212 family)
MHLGLALHHYGTPAYRIEEVLGLVAQRFGVPASFLSTPTSITAAFGKDEEQRVYLTRTDPGEINLGKLSRLDRLTKDVINGAVALDVAFAAIEAIACAPACYTDTQRTLAYGLASAAVARLFGGAWAEIGVAGIIGLTIGTMALLAGRAPRFARLFDIAAAMVSALVAAAAARILGPLSVQIAMLAGLIVLVPGMELTTAMTELSTGNLVSGTARLMGSAVSFLKLGFGAALGTRLGHMWFAPGVQTTPVAAFWADWPGLAVAAVALSVILQAETREFGWILVVSCLGLLGLQGGALCLSQDLGPFLAAVIVTAASNLYARVCDRNPSITQVPALLLLVPGSVGFRSVSALLERNVLSGMETGFSMAVTATGLVAGTLVAGLVLPPRQSS